MKFDKTCQLLIIGDTAVGKTSIISRYANGTFKEEYIATVGLDYSIKQEIIDDKSIQIKIWDTAGQERFKSLTQNYFRNAEGVILTFDVTSTESFGNLKYWISSFKENMEKKNIFIPVIIIGNKIDLVDSREINKEDAEKFSKEKNYKYFETSAKTGEGVDEAIKELVNQVLKQNGQKDDQKETRNSVQIKEDNEGSGGKKKGCC